MSRHQIQHDTSQRPLTHSWISSSQSPRHAVLQADDHFKYCLRRSSDNSQCNRSDTESCRYTCIGDRTATRYDRIETYGNELSCLSGCYIRVSLCRTLTERALCLAPADGFGTSFSAMSMHTPSDSDYWSSVSMHRCWTCKRPCLIYPESIFSESCE